MNLTVDTKFNNNFKAARINMVSIADNHGDLLALPQLIKAVQSNKRDIFSQSMEKSAVSILAIAGDFFMNPLKRGFITNPSLSNGDIQYNFLNKLIYSVKNASGTRKRFETLYTPGNHCFDGGDEWLYKKLKRAPMTTIMSNVDEAKSPLFNELVNNNDNHNVVTQHVVEVPDSKKPELLNKVLFLGVTIPSMDYFVPGLMKGTKFIENSNRNDASLRKKDLKETIRTIKQYVNKFKKQNPNGAVVLLSHTGNRISMMFADKIPKINLILNGHDHKETEILRGNTLILSHGQGSKFFHNVKMFFNDKGIFQEIKCQKYETDRYDPIARKDKKLQEFLQANIGKDLVPIVTFKDSSGATEEMLLDDSIRYDNNILANYVTSAIKRPIREVYPNVSAVGIPGSTFRSGLKSNERRHTFNNLDLLKMFDGVSDSFSQVMIGKVTGQELFDLILENVKNNIKSKTRNVIIQWSDIQVNRSLIKDIKDGKSKAKYTDAIMIRNQNKRKFEQINMEKEYTIVLPDKYLKKESKNITVPAQIRHKFTDINETFDTLFRKYLEMIDYKVRITDKTREQRIL